MAKTPETFLGVDMVQAGPQYGDYLWSDPNNWSDAVVPSNGSSVVVAEGVNSVDDLASLSLSSLDLSQGLGVSLLVTGGSLTVGTVLGSSDFPSDTSLEADAADSAAPVTVTVGTITGNAAVYTADGAGATFTVQSIGGSDNAFEAENGGLVDISGPLTSYGTDLSYSGTASTIALANPGAINGATLGGVNLGDVLELPGTSVSNVTFGC